MPEFLRPYVLTFIPIFVAVDALGNIPLFVSLTHSLNKKQKQRVIRESLLTATVIAVSFMFLGKAILRVLNISVADFQIAGGILLLVISTNLLLAGKGRDSVLSKGSSEAGVFPLGTPLVTGPAVLTMILMVVDNFGWMPSLISLLLNMLIVWFTFRYADLFTALIGESGMRAFSKIIYIFLAAIAVMMMRKGISGFLL
ncbi:MAG: MarC family protein [Candidatus Omnitrophota bacterium]|nr:MarC family protein [Candidatus Omnitrophota bacterium]